jgi:pSer/pThr/pTyr-binding forkhead associated (FHA) protein
MNLKLIVVQGKPLGRALLFSPGEYFLGRGSECHVRFNSEWVSRQHCLLRVTPQSVFLRDLGSRNGTLVNGALLAEEISLSEHDQIQVGPVVFEAHFAEVSSVRPLSPGRVIPLPNAADTTSILPPESPLGETGSNEEAPADNPTANHPISGIENRETRSTRRLKREPSEEE